MKRAIWAVGALMLGALPVAAQTDGQATAALTGPDGGDRGTVTLTPTASGRTHVVVDATSIPEGVHGVHVHETGDCGDGDFSAAGGHLAGDASHGIKVEGGPHPGDLPNGHVQTDGVMAFEAFKSNLPLDDMVFDQDGSAVIVHAGADDYQSQPSGAAGDRIACGVIERSGG